MPQQTKRLQRSICYGFLLCLLNVGFSVADDIRLLKDLSYKTGDLSEYERERCKLDLYLPQDEKGFATIIWFHGGGLRAGDKTVKIAVDFAQRFAQSGVAVASVNYRLDPKALFPAYIEDAAAAFSFIRRKISQYGGAPDRVFISGHSAGGYLAAMVGTDGQYLAKYGLKLSDIAGLMPISGQMITHTTVRQERGIPKTRPIIDKAAPAYHVSKNTAPFLIFAGSQDLPARAEENRYFAAAMKAVGHKDMTYLEVEGRDHGTIASRVGEANDTVATAMLEFIERLGRTETP